MRCEIPLLWLIFFDSESIAGKPSFHLTEDKTKKKLEYEITHKHISWKCSKSSSRLLNPFSEGYDELVDWSKALILYNSWRCDQ